MLLFRLDALRPVAERLLVADESGSLADPLTYLYDVGQRAVESLVSRLYQVEFPVKATIHIAESFTNEFRNEEFSNFYVI